MPVTLDPRRDADVMMEREGFAGDIADYGTFLLKTYSRILEPGAPVHVYIEGDGRAWRTRTRLSDDPTPVRHTVLKLAMLDPAPNVLYVARPGQYLSHRDLAKVNPVYWSDKRFSEEVISAVNAAISRTAAQAGGGSVHLIGYSGGGAVAILLAAHRTDVASVRTVAGNLDPDHVNRLHGVSPLRGSLNPVDRAADVRRIPQIHFIGSSDTVIPEPVARSFMEAGGSECVRIRLVQGASHESGWDTRWRELLSEIPSCAE